MADPGFPRGGAKIPRAVRQLIILKKFAKNCTKMKEFGRGRPGSPTDIVLTLNFHIGKRKLGKLVCAGEHINMGSSSLEIQDRSHLGSRRGTSVESLSRKD